MNQSSGHARVNTKSSMLISFVEKFIILGVIRRAPKVKTAFYHKRIRIIARLLVRDPGARMTVAEALCHPWLHDYTAASAQPLNLLLGDRLRAFMRLTHLQRLLLHLAVLDLPRGKMGHLAHLFQSLVCALPCSSLVHGVLVCILQAMAPLQLTWLQGRNVQGVHCCCC